MAQAVITAPLPGSSFDSTARGLVDERLVLFYFVASLIYMVASMLAGWFYSLQFIQAYAFPGIELMSPASSAASVFKPRAFLIRPASLSDHAMRAVSQPGPI